MTFILNKTAMAQLSNLATQKKLPMTTILLNVSIVNKDIIEKQSPTQGASAGIVYANDTPQFRTLTTFTNFNQIIMQRNGFNGPCFAGGMIYGGAHTPARPTPHFGGSRPVQYGPCFGAPVPQPAFQPGACFMPAAALRRPIAPNPCHAAPAPHRYDPCFH